MLPLSIIMVTGCALNSPKTSENENPKHSYTELKDMTCSLEESETEETMQMVLKKMTAEVNGIDEGTECVNGIIMPLYHEFYADGLATFNGHFIASKTVYDFIREAEYSQLIAVVRPCTYTSYTPDFDGNTELTGYEIINFRFLDADGNVIDTLDN